MSPFSPSGPLSRARSRAALGIERAAGRADAYVARCLAALGRLRVTGKRTRKRTIRVKVILCCAEARSALLNLGRRFVARGMAEHARSCRGSLTRYMANDPRRP